MYQPSPTNVPIDPIISRLRARTVAEVLDHAFRLYRRHFLTFLAVIAVVHAPLLLLIQGGTAFLLGDLLTMSEELQDGDVSTNRLNDIFTYLIVAYIAIFGLNLLYGLLQKVSEGALTSAVADSHLDRPVTFGDSYRQVFRQIGPLLGLIFLQILITIAIFVPIVVVFLLAFGLALGDSTAGAGGILVCFSCLLLIPSLIALVYITIRLMITTPALIVEKLGPMQSIRRSWDLIQNFWWRTFALWVVLFVLQLVVQQGPAYLISTIVTLFAPNDLFLQQLLSGLVVTVTTLIYVPLQLVAVTLYYFDLRVRKEGYDLETAMSQRYSPTQPILGPEGYGYPQYGQPPYSQTQPTPGYTPPTLGGGTPTQPTYNYNPYPPTNEQPYPPPTRPISETPTTPTPEEQGNP